MKKGHYTIIILAIGLVLFSGLLSIKDNRKKKVIVYNGNNLLINIDGQVSNDLPTSGNYYLVDYNCDSSNTIVSWNHKTYDLEVSNGKKGGSVYCNLTFKSNPNLSEMPVGSYVDYTGVGGTVGSNNVNCQVGGSASNSDGSVDTESPNSCKGQNARQDLDNSGYTYGYCLTDSYKYVTTGWRLAYVNNDKPVIVSAGSPECNSRTSSDSNSDYIKLANTRALKYCNSEYVDGSCTCTNNDSDGLCDSASSDAWALNENDFHLMIEQNMGKKNSYLYSDISSYISCGNSSSIKECGYNNDLFDNGGYYWLADSDGSGNGVNWYPVYRRVDETTGTYSAGLRPMISLKKSIVVIGGSGTLDDPYKLSTEPLVDLVSNVMAKNAKSDASLDFSKTSSNSGTNGVYVRSDTIDDTYPIYYYRGAVDNNLIFGGFCWKVVRTTETGGLKLIYNGVPSSGQCNNTGTNSTIGNSKFNEIATSLSNVGYMYGTTYSHKFKELDDDTTSYVYGNSVSYEDGTYTLTGGTTSGVWSSIWESGLNNYHYTCFTTGTTCNEVYYIFDVLYAPIGTSTYYLTLTNGKKIEDALSDMLDNNTNSSIVKEVLDEWYYTNIVVKGYGDYIEDTVWCNDRSIYRLGGWSPIGKIYDLGYGLRFNVSNRIRYLYTPSLICSRKVDRFSVNEFVGNGALNYPVGLLTVDELSLAGGTSLSDNEEYYLYNKTNYWTLSPESITMDDSYQSFIYTNYDRYGDGGFGYTPSDYRYSVRPAISLREGVKISESGDGSADNPYVVIGITDVNREKVTVNFNLNGGESINFNSKDVVVGARYGNLATPVKTGYTFAGWYTAVEDGELVTSESVVNVRENQTLYARWTANQ